MSTDTTQQQYSICLESALDDIYISCMHIQWIHAIFDCLQFWNLRNRCGFWLEHLRNDIITGFLLKQLRERHTYMNKFHCCLHNFWDCMVRIKLSHLLKHLRFKSIFPKIYLLFVNSSTLATNGVYLRINALNLSVEFVDF